MAQRSIKAGSTSVILMTFLQDASKTTGDGLAGLVFNTAGLTCYYKRNKGNASVAVTLATMTLGTYAAGGFKEVDAVNMKGMYDFCPPDAALAAGAESVTFYFGGTATNLAPTPILVELTATDNQVAPASVTGNVNDGAPGAGSFAGNTGLAATDAFYAGAVLAWTSGALRGLARKISTYTGATRTLAFTGPTGASDAPFPAAPANGDTFVILGRIG